jgi:hypothetical protein
MNAAAKSEATGVPVAKSEYSLIKVIVPTGNGAWISPDKNSKHYISGDAQFPSIKFEFSTDKTPPFKGKWTMEWDADVSGLRESAKRGKNIKKFQATGTMELTEKFWLVDLRQVIGGTLTVEIYVGQDTFKRSVDVLAKNPEKDVVLEFLSKIENIKGFDKILAQESKFKNFINADGQPVVAFDGGYGMTQLTTPAPSYEQVWNWKENIKGGAKLYQDKQKSAKAYLGQKGRSYTDDQLALETLSRWNGGGYHQWSEEKKAWVRNPDMLCDTKTGNIGWDITLDENAQKTEKDLHDRDQSTYRDPKGLKKDENKWRYSGVCYADHISKN